MVGLATRLTWVAVGTAMVSCHLAGGLEDFEFRDDLAGGGGSTTTSSTSSGGDGAATSTGSGAGPGGSGGLGGGGGAGGRERCELSTFVDGFGGTSLDSSKWSTFGDGGYGFGVEAGVAFIDPAPDGLNSTSGLLDSVAAYDLTDCAVWVEMVTGPGAGVDAEVQFDFRVDGDNEAEIEVESGSNIHFDIEEGGIHLAEANVLYDPTEHRWARIREAGGTLHLETAPDGVSWTVRLSHATPSWVTNGTVRLRLWVNATSAAVGRAEFDNLNRVP